MDKLIKELQLKSFGFTIEYLPPEIDEFNINIYRTNRTFTDKSLKRAITKTLNFIDTERKIDIIR